MSLLLSLCLISVAHVSWGLYMLLRRFVAESPLDNIPGPPPTSFWKGNLDQLFHRRAGWDLHRKLEVEFTGVTKLRGLFGEKLLYVSDPKALKSILLRDQHLYEPLPSFTLSRLLIFGPGLLSTTGDWHRRQRKMLNPAFSTGNIRSMTPLFYQVTHKIRDAITILVEDGPQQIDIHNWLTRTALELIGQGGLGYSFDTLTEDRRNEFGDAVKAFIPTLFSVMTFRQYVPLALKLGSTSVWRKILDILPIKPMRDLKTISDTMYRRSAQIFDTKRSFIVTQGEVVADRIGEGKDIMSILLRANLTASMADRLPDEELIAQMSTLIFAALDTTSNALSHILYLLSLNQAIQEKLRSEIIGASMDERIPYDQLMELPYLDGVCRETMRLYPPITSFPRQTTEEVVLPLSKPMLGLDGTPISELTLPKNTTVFVGIREANRDRALWGDDATEWKPERWLSPLPEAVIGAHIPGVYSHLMSFSGGGRSCIGFKFAELEMSTLILLQVPFKLAAYLATRYPEIVLAVLLSSFKFLPSGEEIVWNLAGVKYPTVGHVTNQPSMPILVERIR